MEPALRALDALVRRLLGDPVEPDWRSLPESLVRRHLLAPLAFTLGAAQFRSDHITSSLQAELRHQSLLEVVGALSAARIDIILLKGIAYAGTIYPDPATRPMSDIDILVPAAATTDAARALQRLGYWHAGGAHQWSARHHALTFKRRGSALDLHRHVVHVGRTRVDIAAVWRDAVPSHVAGALRPRPVHERLLHVANLGRHEMTVPLVNYVDLHRLGFDPSDEQAATAWGLRRSFTAARACIDLLLGRASDGRWWIPSKRELLEGREPPRWVQILRKLSHIDDVSGMVALARATAEGRLRRLAVIDRTRS